MQQGKIFLVIGLIMAILQGGAVRRLGARGAENAACGALALTPLSFPWRYKLTKNGHAKNPKHSVYMILSLSSFLCIALAASDVTSPSPLAWLWIGLILFALSTAFAVSCMTSMAAAHAPSEARGAVLGALRSLGALARAAGPLLASAVYWCSGAAVTYTIGAVILIVPAVMLFRLKT